MQVDEQKCFNPFTQELYEKLDEIIARYKGQPGALIPVLHEAQQLFGYLPEDVQIIIAEGLNIPVVEVFGVVTFYSLFSTEPRGKNIIGVCMGTACYVKGAGAILEKIREILDVEVNGTTKDLKFSLDATRCIGACGLAPVITINEDVYGRVTLQEVPEILKKYQGEEA
jgi:NADH-quinone oxidoreductase subunit E/NADP-reducing hydrogenase subunit HndA